MPTIIEWSVCNDTQDTPSSRKVFLEEGFLLLEFNYPFSFIYPIIKAMDKMEQIKALMHSYADWQTVGNKKQPYHIELQKGNQYFYYFGANHSRDPQNFQYPELKKYWQEFLEKTHSTNIIVLVEGGIRKVRENENEAIQKDSEAGLITFLATQAGVHSDSPEPSRNEERNELTKQFTKEEVQYYYFARVAHQWDGLPNPRPSFEEYMGRFLGRDKLGSNWPDFDFSMENMKQIHKTIFDTALDENNKEFFYSIINPTSEKSVINKVARACSTIRNIYTILKIEEFWRQHKNIFVVFGMAHLILQEPALRELLK